MARRVESLSFSRDLLEALAEILLTRLPGAADGDLTAGTVLLPAARACRELGHRLLEKSGREALLLPRILTDVQWVEQVGGPGHPADHPAEISRALVLARRLEGMDWLEGGPSAAPGLAEAFLAFFDEVRSHGLADRLLDADDAEPVVQLARAADAEVVADEVSRIREVWRSYREAIPYDDVDRLTARAADFDRQSLVTPRPALTVVAGFGRIDPLRARLLRAALDHAEEGILVLPEVAHPLDRIFVATWGPDESATGPEAGACRMAALVADRAEPETAGEKAPALGERLAALDEERKALAEGGASPEFLRADNPEDEALMVAGRVAAWLEDNGTPERGITVATADPGLAARVVARLRDAGLDADNTVGEPLSSLPAGLLLRFVLRAALTDLRADPLLEILGHPYVDLGDAEAATGTWALRLERMFRRETGPQSGLAGLQRRAAERDEAAVRLFERQAPGMREFVDRLTTAFTPLLDLTGDRRRPWSAYLEALRKVWDVMAPEHPLDGGGDPDLRHTAEILDELAAESRRLPEVDLAGFAADVNRILAGQTVAPHRPLGIHIRVTGLVEARLDRSDLLILAGLNEGVFPSPARNPVVLPGRVRKVLGLPTWREARAADAELFLRLQHGAPEVILTWSVHRDGQPALPSPLVERIRLGLNTGPAAEPDRRPWYSSEPDHTGIAAAESAFAAEPAAIPRFVTVRPLDRLSWTALKTWRDCPYRILVERQLALRAEEDVRDEFGKKEYGSIVHAILAAALDAGHPCREALIAGRPEEAADRLTAAARDAFLPGAIELPVRRLWLETFLRVVPDLARIESKRLTEWRPVALEAKFEMPLPVLAEWARSRAAACGIDPGSALADPLPAHAAAVIFTGSVDRIDRRVDGQATAIVDYKTGTAPSPDRILELEDLQLPLYALAVETGCVKDVTGPVAEGLFYGLDEKKTGPVLKNGRPPLDGDEALLVTCAIELIRLAVSAADPEAFHPLLPRAAAGESRGDLPCKWCDLRGTCRIEERCPSPGVAVQLDKIVNAKEVTG